MVSRRAMIWSRLSEWGLGTTIRGRAPREAAGIESQVEAIAAAQTAANGAEPNSALVR